MKNNWTLILGVVFVAGCTAPLNQKSDRAVPNYDIVVSDPSGELLPPPKLGDIFPNSKDVEVTEPLKEHTKRLRSYERYIDRTTTSLEKQVLDPVKDFTAKAVKATTAISGSYDCSLPALSQIRVSEAPRVGHIDADISDIEKAAIAISYAEKLKVHKVEVLKSIDAGLKEYNQLCRKN